MTVFVNPALRQQIENVARTETLVHCCLWFVSLLYLKEVDPRNPGRYFTIGSGFLRQVVNSRSYPEMLALLTRIGAVEIQGRSSATPRGSYRAGHFSKSYRLADRFTRGAEAVTISCPKLEARHEAVSSKISIAAMHGPARRWIVDSYDSATFSLKAHGLLAAHPFKTADARNRTVNHFDNVINHRPRFSVSPSSGRVYYSVASLPKVLRHELLLDGEPTAEIDISASQPTLLATLYPAECAEKADYIAFVQRPTFYEDLGSLVGQSWTRDESKTQFFHQIAYGSFWCAAKYELLVPFTLRFPILARIMAIVKQNGNKVLPSRMQAIEASITIDGACSDCREEEIKVLPVHDSLICKRDDAPIVADILARCWFARTLIPPRMKIDGKNVLQAA